MVPGVLSALAVLIILAAVCPLVGLASYLTFARIAPTVSEALQEDAPCVLVVAIVGAIALLGLALVLKGLGW